MDGKVSQQRCAVVDRQVGQSQMRIPRATRQSVAGLFLLVTVAAAGFGSSAAACEVTPLGEARAKEYGLDASFYKKCMVVQDILIATSERVSDYAHLEAA